MIDINSIEGRIAVLKRNAANLYGLKENELHIGHIALQAMLDEPDFICQIDAATDGKETNKSVARRTCRLATAMRHYGLKPQDPVIIMGNHHMDLCIPYFACHFNGYSLCAVDTSIGQNDLIKLFPYLHPKMIFCQKSCEEKVKKAFKVNRLQGKIVIFDDDESDIAAFVKIYNGTHVNYRPAEFDHSQTTAWLMLTSGTTGMPKVAIIPFDTLLKGIVNWWSPFPEKLESCLIMKTLQWVSSLVFFISGPLKGLTRIQSSDPLAPQTLVKIINKYRPSATVWTPHLLGQFLIAAENVCDLSCFKYIAIGGSAIEKPLLDRFRKKCNAFLYLVYGMTELLGPIFDFDHDTPFGSSGKPQSKYEFRLMDANNQPLKAPHQNGELWVRGDAFFKGYLNNLEETRAMLTEDGWVKTGDIFYRDAQNYYYYVERKRLLFKHYGFLISPLQMEEIIKRDPSVADACVVSLPSSECQEMPVAALIRKNGDKVDLQEIMNLLRKNMEGKRLTVSFFFVDSLPITPSGKVHRAKVKEIAATAERTVCI